MLGRSVCDREKTGRSVRSRESTSEDGADWTWEFGLLERGRWEARDTWNKCCGVLESPCAGISGWTGAGRNAAIAALPGSSRGLPVRPLVAERGLQGRACPDIGRAGNNRARREHCIGWLYEFRAILCDEKEHVCFAFEIHSGPAYIRLFFFYYLGFEFSTNQRPS